MPRPQTSVDRFLAREGWHFAGWSVTRSMVKLHNKIGWCSIIVAPVVSGLMYALGDPSLAVIGVPFAIVGFTELGVYHWAKSNPDIREESAPKLSRDSRRLLKRLVRSVVGTETLGPKFMGRILKPSSATVKRSAKEILNETSFDAFEKAAGAYNRLVGICLTDRINNQHALKTAIESMPVLLDYVAKLESFPEQESAILPRINQIVEQLDSLASNIVPAKSEAELNLHERLSAMSQLNEDHESLDSSSLNESQQFRS